MAAAAAEAASIGDEVRAGSDVGAGICGRWWRKLGNWAETVGTGEKSKGYACYLRTGAAKWAQWRLGLLGQSQEAGE